MPFFGAILTGAGFGTGFKVAEGLENSLQISEKTEKVVEFGKSVCSRVHEWALDTVQVGSEPKTGEDEA